MVATLKKGDLMACASDTHLDGGRLEEREESQGFMEKEGNASHRSRGSLARTILRNVLSF
jgi:hypothetical protein